MTIHQSLAAVMADVGAVAKSERNQSQGFNFRGIDAVVNAVAPAFRKHGVIAMPTVESATYEQVPVGQQGKMMASVRLVVTYTFWAGDGTCVAATVASESMDSGDKATAKAMSVAYRTALLQVLCLPTDEPDPDHDIYERSGPAVKAEKQPAKREPAAPAAAAAVSKSQRIVLEKVLAKAGTNLVAASKTHLGAEHNWDTLTRDDLGILLAALSSQEVAE